VSTPTPPAPRVWVVVSDKAGDNAQVDAVVARLPWPVELRRLVFGAAWVAGKPRFEASLDHVDLHRSDTLEPPWPDLVLTIGRRPAMAALWIKEQSGDRSKVVLFGRPKRWLHRFDLIVAPAQYDLPDAANVLPIGLPLMRVEENRLAAAREAWRDRFSEMPRPLIGVLVGGTTNPFVLNANGAVELLCRASAYREPGGSLFVTTSRRTPGEAIEAMRKGLPLRAELYEWRAGADANPYLGLLAHADGFVVTGDSMSMITEVARLGRPLAIHPLAERAQWRKRVRRALSGIGASIPSGPLAPLFARLGLYTFNRDLTHVHEWLFARGLAVPTGAPFTKATLPADDELTRVVERVVALGKV